MAKLIHAEKLSYVQANSTLYSNNAWTEEAKKSIIFTDDGYIVTKNKEYFIPPKLDISNLTITDTVYYDQYGRICTSSDGNKKDSFNITQIKDALLSKGTEEKTLYLLGSTSGASASSAYTPNKFAGLYATLGTDGKTTIHADNIAASSISFDTDASNAGKILYVTKNGISFSGGSSESDKVLISGGTNAPSWKSITSDAISIATAPGADIKSNLVTVQSVYDTVKNSFAANNAMVFQGPLATLSGLPINNYRIGYTYMVSADGITINEQKCEIGDLVIAISDAVSGQTAINQTHWTVIQTNIDGAVTASEKLSKGALVVGNGRSLSSFAFPSDTETGVGKVLKTTHNNGDWGLEWSTDIPNRAVYVGDSEKLSASSTNALKFTAGDRLTVSYTNGAVQYSHSQISDFAEKSSNLYKIAIDEFGHITSASEWTPSNLTISGYDKTTSAAKNLTYDTTSALTLKADTGLKLEIDGTTATIKHSTSVGSTLTNVGLYAIEYDGNGHIKNAKKITDGDNITFNFPTPSTNNWTISATDTWRPVYAYKINGTALEQVLESTSTNNLQFGSEFVFSENDSTGSNNTAEIHLAWAEVNANGVITYSI